MTMPSSGVVHVFGRMNAAGAELRTVELIARTGLSFDFLAVSGEPGALDDELGAAGHRVDHTRLTAAGLVIIARAMRRNRYRVVHSHMGSASGPILLAAALARVPQRIAHSRSDTIGGRSGLRKATVMAVSRWLVARLATRIVGVSPSALASDWRSDWADDPRCCVIPNGIDTSRLRAEAAEATEARPPAVERLVVASVARDLASKNRARSIRIWSKLESQRSASLMLVGGLGPDDHAAAADARATASPGNKITELGEIRTVPAVLGGSHVLLSTSTREGLPGVVLEALAIGIPVVSSDVPGACWIADQVEGVEILSLDDDDAAWASGLARAAHADPAAIRASFDAGPFTFDAALAAFRELWGLGE